VYVRQALPVGGQGRASTRRTPSGAATSGASARRSTRACLRRPSLPWPPARRYRRR